MAVCVFYSPEGCEKSQSNPSVLTADTPIRIQPGMLLFPNPSSMKDIYWDPGCNQKSGLYGTGILGPPHLFTTLDGDTHKNLRKALAGPPVCYARCSLIIWRVFADEKRETCSGRLVL